MKLHRLIMSEMGWLAEGLLLQAHLLTDEIVMAQRNQLLFPKTLNGKGQIIEQNSRFLVQGSFLEIARREVGDLEERGE